MWMICRWSLVTSLFKTQRVWNHSISPFCVCVFVTKAAREINFKDLLLVYVNVTNEFWLCFNCSGAGCNLRKRSWWVLPSMRLNEVLLPYSGSSLTDFKGEMWSAWKQNLQKCQQKLSSLLAFWHKRQLFLFRHERIKADTRWDDQL